MRTFIPLNLSKDIGEVKRLQSGRFAFVRLFMAFALPLFLLCLVLLPGSVSKAANNYDQLVADFASNGITVSNDNNDSCKNYWESHSDKKVLAYINSSGNGSVVFGDNLSYDTQGALHYYNADQFGYILYSSSGKFSDANWNSSYYPNGTITGYRFVGFYDGLGNTDWGAMTFDPSIPTPLVISGKQSVRFTLPSHTVNGVSWGGRILSCWMPKWTYYDNYWDYCVSHDEELYIYLAYRFWLPNSFNLNNNTYNWKNSPYVASETYELSSFVAMQSLPEGGGDFDMYDSFEVTGPNGTFGKMYYDYYSFVDSFMPQFTGDIEYTINYDDGRSLTFDNRSQVLEGRYMPCQMGGIVEVYTCYFAVRDGIPYCGMWQTWTSTSPYETNVADLSQDSSFEFPYYASSVLPEMGEIATTAENPSAPQEVPTYSNNVVINNGTTEQSVPNNMNYPTIVQYNHDNIFTSMISTYNDAASFFGDFPVFFAACLGWIPSPIWAIIGLGFSVAILVMIIKII